MIFITGDTHRDFKRISDFCLRMKTTRKDLMIILGDAGINYSPGRSDYILRSLLSDIPITFFCIHGNHEMRPQNIEGYRPMRYKGGIVYVDPEFPTLLFARDGDIFSLQGRSTLVIGGAYSVDKHFRLENGYSWFADEQPDEVIKQRTIRTLDKAGWKVDTVLSHTSPYRYRPTEVFLPGLDESTVDVTTERWLDEIEEKLDYRRWFLGHFHTEKRIDRIRIMFEDIDKF